MKLIKKMEELIAEYESMLTTKFDSYLDNLLEMYETAKHNKADISILISIDNKIDDLMYEMADAGVYKIIDVHEYGYSIKTFASKSSANDFCLLKAYEQEKEWKEKYPDASVNEDGSIGRYSVSVGKYPTEEYEEFIKLYHSEGKEEKKAKEKPSYIKKDGKIYLDLWTFQAKEAFDDMMTKGVLKAPNDKSLLWPWKGGIDRTASNAYRWMIGEMKAYLPAEKPDDVHYPVWAWYKYGGLYGRPDAAAFDMACFPDPGFLIHFEAPLDECMLSNHNTWMGPMNGSVHYNYPEEWSFDDRLDMDDCMDHYFVSHPDWVEKAWESTVLIHASGTKGISNVQTCLWKIKKEWVKDVENLADPDAKYRNFCLV